MKFILVEVVDRFIYPPLVFDSHAEAFAEMKSQVEEVGIENTEYGLRKNDAWASIRDGNYDWKIFEI